MADYAVWHAHTTETRDARMVAQPAYPCVANGAQMATWHREKAYVAIEREELELAVAHLVASMAFLPSEQAVQEMLYIRKSYGRDFTQMDEATAVRVLEEGWRARRFAPYGCLPIQALLV